MLTTRMVYLQSSPTSQVSSFLLSFQSYLNWCNLFLGLGNWWTKIWWTNTILKTVLFLSLLVCVQDSAWCLPWADNFVSVCLRFHVYELTATIGSLEDWAYFLEDTLEIISDTIFLIIISSLIWTQVKQMKFLVFRSRLFCSLFPEHKALWGTQSSPKLLAEEGNISQP